MATSQYELKVKPKIPLIIKWCRNGLTDEEIWNRLKISKSSFYGYQHKYSEFKEIVQKNKEYCDAEVENQFYKNCLGYEYTEQALSTKKEIIYENGKKIKEVSVPIVVDIVKHKPSDVNASKYWLQNRDPENWKDNRQIDIGNKDDKPFKLEDVI